MAHDQGEACAYVKQSVLRELEQERYRLKWQLSRALHTSDSHAAELEASKAKVKDLLTIVELNKGVADQAVQRSHGQDAKRIAELETLHQQYQQQHQRYVDVAVRLMSRRVHNRQQRVAFHSLQQSVQLQRRRREALRRLHTRIRRKILQRSLQRWKQLDGNNSMDSAKVYPLQLGQPVFSNGNGVTCSVSTSVKVDNNSGQIRRWQLLRKMWRNWERVVRWKRKIREFLTRAAQRFVRSVITAWRSRIRMLRQRRVSLRRLLARNKQRLQQLGLTRFRLRCAEILALEWAEVLKAAHNAMEEERKLRADVQSSAACELHTAYVREQQRQQRFTEVQAQRFEASTRRECTYRALMMLRCNVIQARQKTAIALRFQKLQHRQRLIRRLFTSWRSEASRSRRIKMRITTWNERRTHSTKASAFRIFAWTLHRRRQQRFRLRSLISKQKRLWLIRGWLALQISSAVQEHKAIARVEMWQFSQQVEATQTCYLQDVRRNRRVVLKYQVTCALAMADKNQEKLLRRVLRSWSTCTVANARRRCALKRLLGRRHLEALRSAVHKWVHLHKHTTTRCHQMERFHLTRRHRAVVLAFDMWKRYTHDKLRSRLARYRQRSCFHVWHHWRYRRQQRTRSFARFLQRMTEKWQRQAFQSWKLNSDHYTRAYANRDAVEHELVSRLWRRWIGFVSSRLRKQRHQQQEVLSGVTSSLQRAILSTAFGSWRTTRRDRHSQEELIVRVFRRNVGRIRASKHLHAWHQYSELTARRRAALKRICQRHRIRRLAIKWRYWLRVSVSGTITWLEATSTRAQEQVDRVTQSTGRVNVLRRVMRTWRLVSAAATRQQRRRALFAEKRRYMALQGSMRQWQRSITCCSLTKQRRMLQLLLKRLQLSLKRQAFTHWGRRAHAETLYQRDRVSAELFRRSETRVMALAEEIRAERERRILFTAWRSVISRKKKRCECLQGIWLKQQLRLLQDSWSLWTHYARTQRCVARLSAMIAQRLKAAAWRKLMQMYHHHGLKATGVRLAGVIWHKVLVCHALNRWKRVDSFLSRHAALVEAKASSIQSMLAFKETIAWRHHSKRVLSSVFATWKQQSARIPRLRRHLCDIIQRLVQATTVHYFHKWREIVGRQNCLLNFWYRVVKRQQTREVRSALGRWRRWTLEMAHRQKLEQTKQALAHQREISAKRIAAVKFLSWQRPCLEVHFVHWKAYVEQRRRYVVEQRRALAVRRTRRLLQRVWRSWRHLVRQSKRRAQILSKILNSSRVALLAHGFNRWDQWCDWRHDVDFKLVRLVKIHKLWQRRRGFSALRQHQHEAIRRQSIMTASAFSVHSTRQRERQSQRMRSVALVLQRKTNAALYDRCFRHWVMYVKTKARTKSVIMLARVRTRKRMVRRCFAEWHLQTRHNIIIRQKLHRRQQIWQYCRQRRVWNAWVYFTQHSLDLKHSMYDRLIVCALRHSLQAAWGRWKAYTRHANDLMDAQRVAQWEHATAERDRMIDTLEDKHERLLLRAAQIGQQNNALRQRLVSSATRRIGRMLQLGLKTRVATAFGVWKLKLQQVWALQSRLQALSLRYQRLTLQHWHSIILHVRAANEVRRVQLDTTEWAARVVHACTSQWLKRRVFLSWRAVGRAHQRINRHLAVAQRRREIKLIRTCWKSWKSMIDVQSRQCETLVARQRLITVLQAYWRWKRFHECSGIARIHAIRTFVFVRRVWQRRLVIDAWHRWRNFTAEEDAAILHTRLVLVKLDHEKAIDHYTCSQLSLRTFSHWKLYARSRCERRDGHAQAFAIQSRRQLLDRHFNLWKGRAVGNQSRFVLVRRMDRHLGRHYRTLTKYALWVWFARVQCLTHMTTQLQVASKHLSPATDAPARVARAVLTELLLAERQLQRSRQRSAWRLVNATVRNAHRRMLQTAFDRLAAARSSRHMIHVANACAFVDRMTIMLLRRGFERWKQQYLALAIEEAEAAQQQLLRALHHVTSYRQTLDPYALQR